jgi:hypothetical protein
MKDLGASVVIDDQNVHRTGHGLFLATAAQRRHETLIDPLLFAGHLLRVRNHLQRPGMAHAGLRKVLVFRGQPSPEHDQRAYARSQAQRSHWERDPRAQVTLRPLKYEYVRDANGRPVVVAGRRTVTSKREKGLDVLCAWPPSVRRRTRQRTW